MSFIKAIFHHHLAIYLEINREEMDITTFRNKCMESFLMSTEFEKKAKEIVSQMTLEEKVYQTIHNSPAIPRLSIPQYNWWNEALHGIARAGVATVFPQAIGLAATFDTDLLARIADAISTEGRAKFNMQQQFGDCDIYKGLTFWAPNVNIFRDPRWGRGHETYGEDPYLTSRLAVSFIKGIQGNDPKYLKAAACAKHFAVHSGPESLRHSFNAIVTKKDMYETYLPAFKACVQEAGVEAIMGAYNRVNGEPCCGSKILLQDILRQEWGFKGHIVSDCWAIRDFNENHHVTSTPVESAALAMNNGCDLNCGSIFLNLIDAVKQGLVTEERLNEAVTHLLVTRMKLGMLAENTCTPFDQINYTECDTKKHSLLNLEAAGKTLVLLKNSNNILPLDAQKIKTIGIIGPNANSRRALVGNYEGTASRYFTVSEGIQEYLSGSEIRILFSEGCHLYKDKVSALSQTNDRLSEIRGVCAASDVVIVCLGLDAGLEGEEGDTGNEFASGDKPDLKFPGLQNEVLKTACESGKPVILVVLAGSAMDLTYADQHAAAIIQGWYPGAMGGFAIAQLLFGDINPEGKLPITFYRTTEELPDFTDYAMAGRTYRYMTNKALYPFGFGLSYTDFELSNVQTSLPLVVQNGTVNLDMEVQNTGSMAGAQTIQVYIKCLQPDTPNPQLKAFSKLFLKPGETQNIHIELSDQVFGLFDDEARLMLYQGKYFVYVGFCQPDERSIELTGKRPFCIELTCEKTADISR